MTVGELALYFNQQFSLGCNLTVVPMQGWDREMFYDDCGLNWVLPSPNIPTLNSAVVYPGMCLLEGTNVSEGRGTTRPFEVSGAPWVEAREMVERVEAFGLAGVAARPMNFIPTFHKWSGELLGGVQLHVTDRQVFEPFRAALALLMVYRELGGDQFRWLDPPYEYEYEKLPFDILCGTDTIRTMIEAGAALEAVVASWQQELDAFKEVREKYLLY
jgi:uncharacterized protein YbbC (DUF1343 family)